MSQENTYSQVISVQTVKTPTYAESVASLVKDLMHTAPAQLKANALTLQPATQRLAVTHASTLQSPNSLKIIQKHFEKNLSALNQRQLMSDKTTLLKTAALVTMQQENLKIQDKTLLAEKITGLMAATSLQQINEKITSIFSEIKNQHTHVFNQTLTLAISSASKKVGFTQLRSEIVSLQLTRIVATNQQGYNLISEIHTDTQKSIDIKSELEGITDGSCATIMQNFCTELEKQGVTSQSKERKPTGGIARMPYAQNLQKERSKRRVFPDEKINNKESKNQQIQLINKK